MLFLFLHHKTKNNAQLSLEFLFSLIDTTIPLPWLQVLYIQFCVHKVINHSG